VTRFTHLRRLSWQGERPPLPWVRHPGGDHMGLSPARPRGALVLLKQQNRLPVPTGAFTSCSAPCGAPWPPARGPQQYVTERRPYKLLLAPYVLLGRAGPGSRSPLCSPAAPIVAGRPPASPPARPANWPAGPAARPPPHWRPDPAGRPADDGPAG
jgi:hypothetical protein